jgi:hypothetical protein
MPSIPAHRAPSRFPFRAVLVLLALAAAGMALAPTAGAATVATSERQSCGIFSGSVRCWGQDTSGALGFVTDSSAVPYATPVGAPIKGATHLVGTFTGGGGSGHFCAIAGGAAWCWGPNGYGTAGTGTKERELPVPVAVPALAGGVTLIDKNASRSCGIVNGGAWCWGNAYLGNNTKADSAVPVAVSGMGSGVTDVAVGWRSSCVLQGGTVSCFGNGIHGQLGGGKGSRTPDGAVGLPGPATAIDAGVDSACAVVNGGVWCWGSNGDGRLGIGDAKAKGGAVPVNVTGLPAGAGAVDIAGNASHYCVLMANGSVRCWGSNANGGVGNGATSGNVPAPAVVPLPGPASSVAVSNSHTCATVGANFYCWGSNSGGQLGGGTIGGMSGTPVKVLLPPKATVKGVAKPIKVSGSRTVTIGTVACPIGTGSCTVALPTRVTVKLKRVAYKVSITKLATVAPGATGQIIATVSTGLYKKLVGKSVRVSARVVATNHGGRLAKRAVATIKR